MLIEIILARLLLPETFGVMAILLVLVNIADVVAQSGLGVALIQRQDITALSYTTAFWLSLAIALGLYILIWLLSPLIAEFYKMGELALYLRVLALVLFAKAFNSIQRSYLQKRMQFKALFVASTIAVIVSGAAGVILAYCDFGVWALVGQTMLQGMLACVIMLLQIDWRPSFAFSKTEARQLYGYGWKICVSGIFGKLYTGLSELIIGKACTSSDLGYYSNGAKWPNAAMSAFSNALENVLFPAFSRISSDLGALREAVKKAVAVGTFVMAMVAFLLVLVAKPLIALVLTERWLPCVPVFQLTCISCSLYMLQIANLRAYMALGDSALYMKLQMIKVGIGTAVISLTAILTADIYCVALATMLDVVFNIVIIDLWPSKRKLGLSRFAQIKVAFPYVVLGIIALVVAYPIGYLGLSNVTTLILQAIVFLALYWVVAALFKLDGCKQCLLVVKSLISKGKAKEEADK